MSRPSSSDVILESADVILDEFASEPVDLNERIDTLKSEISALTKDVDIKTLQIYQSWLENQLQTFKKFKKLVDQCDRERDNARYENLLGMYRTLYARYNLDSNNESFKNNDKCTALKKSITDINSDLYTSILSLEDTSSIDTDTEIDPAADPVTTLTTKLKIMIGDPSATDFTPGTWGPITHSKEQDQNTDNIQIPEEYEHAAKKHMEETLYARPIYQLFVGHSQYRRGYIPDSIFNGTLTPDQVGIIRYIYNYGGISNCECIETFPDNCSNIAKYKDWILAVFRRADLISSCPPQPQQPTDPPQSPDSNSINLIDKARYIYSIIYAAKYDKPPDNQTSSKRTWSGIGAYICIAIVCFAWFLIFLTDSTYYIPTELAVPICIYIGARVLRSIIRAACMVSTKKYISPDDIAECKPIINTTSGGTYTQLSCDIIGSILEKSKSGHVYAGHFLARVFLPNAKTIYTDNLIERRLYTSDAKVSKWVKDIINIIIQTYSPGCAELSHTYTITDTVAQTCKYVRDYIRLIIPVLFDKNADQNQIMCARCIHNILCNVVQKVDIYAGWDINGAKDPGEISLPTHTSKTPTNPELAGIAFVGESNTDESPETPPFIPTTDYTWNQVRWSLTGCANAIYSVLCATLLAWFIYYMITTITTTHAIFRFVLLGAMILFGVCFTYRMMPIPGHRIVDHRFSTIENGQINEASINRKKKNIDPDKFVEVHRKEKSKSGDAVIIKGRYSPSPFAMPRIASYRI
jgi:hypothetical protein